MPVTAFVRQTPQTDLSYDRWDGYKSWDITPRPHLEYSRRHYEHLSGPIAAHSGASMGFRAGYESRLEHARSYNRAYSKFVAKMGDRSELGTTLAEYQSAHQMFMKRGTQLLRGWTYLKQGKFRRFLETFGIKPKRGASKRRFNKPKEAGGLWLEYWMGWAPTASDLHASAMVMAQVVPEVTIRAAGKENIKAADSYGTWQAVGSTVCLLQGNLEVTNPNLQLASQLGLINPVSILYNLMPWSWMLGWFVNFSQVINSFSDFAGVKVSRFMRTYHSVWIAKPAPDVAQYYGTYRGVQMYRLPLATVPMPYLRFTVPSALSVTRAATLISLLVQKLKD